MGEQCDTVAKLQVNCWFVLSEQVVDNQVVTTVRSEMERSVAIAIGGQNVKIGRRINEFLQAGRYNTSVNHCTDGCLEGSAIATVNGP
jgi:hypothetical protein